jgi:hypothetical protein
MKRSMIALLSALLLVLVGCSGDKEERAVALEVKMMESLTPELSVGNEFKNITLNDQFDKAQSLSSDTKKVIFVFTKKSGHIARELFNTKPDDYLAKNSIVFVADIHKMPSMIANMVAIPDLKKHNYPILLIRDDEFSKQYLNEAYKDYITVIDINNFKITGITLVGSGADLDKLVQP